MAETITISLDAMGGDEGAQLVIPGADIALTRRPEMRCRLYGDKRYVLPLLDQYPRVKTASEFEHCDVTVRMDDKPSQALRHGRWRSSMWKSIEAVKTGAADVAVSAGNTGALMAMAKFCLRMMAGVERPAIAGIWPTLRGESVVLDVGASIGSDARDLFEFALMGGAMARALYDIDRPTVGLLNIGVEEVKGLEPIKAAGQMLKDADLATLDYVGFVEGDDIGKGTVDVVVTEGFAGNIALKTAEGTARQLSGYLRAAMSRTLLARVGYLLARDAFDRLRAKMDPRRVNGGVFLGLNGIVIKSHGGTDAEGYASAIELGHSMVRNQLLKKITDDLAAQHPPQPAAERVVEKTGAM